MGITLEEFSRTEKAQRNSPTVFVNEKKIKRT